MADNPVGKQSRAEESMSGLSEETVNGKRMYKIYRFKKGIHFTLSIISMLLVGIWIVCGAFVWVSKSAVILFNFTPWIFVTISAIILIVNQVFKNKRDTPAYVSPKKVIFVKWMWNLILATFVICVMADLFGNNQRPIFNEMSILVGSERVIIYQDNFGQWFILFCMFFFSFVVQDGYSEHVNKVIFKAWEMDD